MSGNDPYLGYKAMDLQEIRFEDHKEFTPDLSPAMMLRMGVFNGYFFLGETNNYAEFPMDWFVGARIADRPGARAAMRMRVAARSAFSLRRSSSTIR